jgi:hypothetical protein
MDEDDAIPPLVSAADWAQPPLDVRQAFLSLVQMVRELSARVQELEAQPKQTSRNTSKPPSSDPPSAPPAAPRVPRGKPKGAQPGLPDQQRPLLPEDHLDAIVPLRPNEESAGAQRMLACVRPLFAAWEAYQIGVFDQIALQQALMPVRLALHELLRRGAASEWDKLQATCQDLLRHWEALWMFSRQAGLEPTNNRAERALRPAVIWRKSCYGTQSALGSRFVERMLSVCATCGQQGRNLFVFLTEAVQAAWASQPAPSIFAIP